MPAPALSADEIARLLHEVFPQAFFPGCGLTLERVEYGDIRVRRAFHDSHLRPGGTVSGPTMMELADFAMYVAVFSADRQSAAGGHDQSQHQFPAQAGRRRPHRRRQIDEGWQTLSGRAR